MLHACRPPLLTCLFPGAVAHLPDPLGVAAHECPRLLGAVAAHDEAVALLAHPGLARDPRLRAPRRCKQTDTKSHTLSRTSLYPAESALCKVRVHTSCKNGSCEIMRLFETFGREKSCMSEQEPFWLCVNSLLSQESHEREAF